MRCDALALLSRLEPRSTGIGKSLLSTNKQHHNNIEIKIRVREEWHRIEQCIVSVQQRETNTIQKRLLRSWYYKLLSKPAGPRLTYRKPKNEFGEFRVASSSHTTETSIHTYKLNTCFQTFNESISIVLLQKTFIEYSRKHKYSCYCILRLVFSWKFQFKSHSSLLSL